MSLSDLYLRLDLGQQWSGRDIFSTVAELQGDIFRDKEGRRTLRFQLDGKSYFLKYHQGVGWQEIVKNCLQLRAPVISAKNEWQAIRFLEKHGIGTMTLAGYGERGTNPAEKESFVITDDLTNTMSLEDLGQQWHDNPPSFATKKALIERLASISKTMHENGMNHRDYYLCHFLLDDSFAKTNTFTSDTELFLIDLHRAQIRENGSVPTRWLVKDLGALYFSAMDVQLTQRDLIRFAKAYSGMDLHGVVENGYEFWQEVRQRARKLRQADGAAINVSLNPISSFLQGHKTLPVPFEIEAAGQQFECSKVLRLLPGKRLVVEAKSEQHHAVLKLFSAMEKGSRELDRERFGHKWATEAGVNVPEQLFAGNNQQGCLTVAYQFLTDGKTLAELGPEQRNSYLTPLFELVAKLHCYGIYQHDIHLDNFLVVNSELYLLDLGSIKRQKEGKKLSATKSLKNLARLVAQFSFEEQVLLKPHIEQYYRLRDLAYTEAARSYFAQLCGKAWQKRKNNYISKCFRNCSMTRYHSDLSSQYAFRRDFLEGKADDLINNIDKYVVEGELLKDGNSATVVKTLIDGQQLVIKRYNVKDNKHFIRRCLRPSRAAVSWRNANLLEFISIPTVKPLGFIETRKFGLRHTAYFISEYNDADELSDVYQSREPEDGELAQLKTIFGLLEQVKVSHGDLKASNFLITKQGKISLIDLDAMKQHPCKPSFDKAFVKDKKRFMQNWQYEHVLNERMKNVVNK